MANKTRRCSARAYRFRLLMAFVCVAAVFSGLWFLAELLDDTTEEQTPEVPMSLHEPLPPNESNTTQALPELAGNPYDLTAFHVQDDRVIYTAGNTEEGIDVSSHQGEINWELVKQDGIEFAIIRAGYRGYTQGLLEEDPYFQRNLKEAEEAGIQIGVYFFSQAISKEEAVEEAKFVLQLLDGRELAYPVYFDWEEIPTEARTDHVDTNTLTECAKAFCETIVQEGYQAGVYFNQVFGYQRFDLSSLQAYSLWLAQYEQAPDFLFDFQLWQYTCEGKVNGIETIVDRNLSFTPRGGKAAN